MRLAELYERAVNWPSQTAIIVTMAVAAAFVVVGFLLSFMKRAWIGRGLGLVGLIIVVAGLFLLSEQSYTERPRDSITVTRFRRTDHTRQLLFLAMTALPCAAGVVMWASFVKTRLRRRGQVPRHLMAGRNFFAQKDYEGALREYSMAIHSAPELAEAYCRRGSVYQELGKTAQALTDFDRAIACDPRYSSAYLARGQMRTETGDFDGALADFAQLMVIRANDPAIYLQRGACLVKMGHLGEAAADFQRVLKLTNHSDYAEPAKNYLHQIEARSGLPLHYNNGTRVLPASPQPRAQDHAI
jgi:Tfp pilus assembly protein PilF